MGKSGSSDRYSFLGLQNNWGWWLQPWNWKMLSPWKESYDKPRQHIEKQRHQFTNKGLHSQNYDFFNSHVWMWDLDHKKGFGPKNWCFQVVVLEKTLESSLGSKEIKSVNPKGNQPWLFIERTDVEAEAPILWPPDVKSWLIGKDPDSGNDWRQKKKGAAEDEMVHWTLFLGDSDEQWSLAYGSSLSCKELDMTYWLNHW